MRLAGVLVLCVCVLLTGCHVGTSERFVMSSKRVQTRKARFDGEYRLYRAEATRDPVFVRRLLKGQAFGFRDDGGKRVAVAAADVFALENGQFEWRMAADEGQVDPVLTIAVFGFVGIVATAIGFAAFDASFDFAPNWR